jgi:two-component system, NarL family, sensor histidine kinase UhpB
MAKPLRVLIIEDSEDDAQLLVKQLRKDGFIPEYTVADTADQVSKALNKPGWDIIISDYVLPDFSGLEALKILQDKGVDVPCLIVSGKIDEETAVAAMRGGARDYIMKDNLKRLGPAVERELAASVMRREHKQIAEIIASEKFSRTILEQAADAIIVCDTEGTILRSSAKAHNLLGVELEGGNFDQVFSRFYPLSAGGGPECKDFKSGPVSLSALYRGEIPSGSEIASIENGRTRQSLILNYSSLSEKGDLLGYSIALTDITARRQVEAALARAKEELEVKVRERTLELARANEQLKQYVNRITQVQEEERKRIAYELHDDTAQYLSILKMQLNALINSTKIRSPETREKLRFLEKDANRAFNDVRRYSHDLRPVVLEHQGLLAALEQVADDYNKLGQLTIEVNVAGEEPQLGENIKLGFFRIAQEALNNIRKHANASQANIDIRFLDHRLEMIVRDNGTGFDVQEAAVRSGGKGSLGLMSMQERASLIGAKFKIESKPGAGTAVKAEVKL